MMQDLNKTMAVTVDELYTSLLRFGVVDYSVFFLVLAMSLGVGIYYNFCERKMSVDDYLVGGRKMKTLPISISLLATVMSPITLMGAPTEIYLFGIHFAVSAFAHPIVSLILQYFFINVFHELHLTTVYEYLNARFDKSTRIFSILLYILCTFSWTPVMVYVSAIAFNQVTGIPMYIFAPLLCVICVLYTTTGGFKAVVWTDVLQTIVTLGSLTVLIIKATVELGGFKEVWQRNVNGGRIEPLRWTLNMEERVTVMNTILNGIITNTAFNIHQSFVQRYISLPSLEKANRALWIYTFGFTVYFIACCYCGLLTYAAYYSCDPLSTKLAKRPDQLLPLYVMDVIGEIPGLTGLFIAGVCCAALSSMSSIFNSISAVVLKDFVNGLLKINSTPRQSSLIMKASVITTGVINLAIVFLVDKLGSTVVQVLISVQSIPNGPMLGILTCATMLPWVTSKGMKCGVLAGIAFLSWIYIGARIATSTGGIANPTWLATSTEGCTYNFTFTNVSEIIPGNKAYVLPLYRVSFMFYSFISWLVTVVIALGVSFATCPNNPANVNEKLMSPLVRKIFRLKKGEYQIVEMDDRKNQHDSFDDKQQN